MLSAPAGGGNKVSFVRMIRKPPLVRPEAFHHSSIKASLKPKELHIYLGNTDISTSSDQVKKISKKIIFISECLRVKSSIAKRLPILNASQLTIDYCDALFTSNKDKVFKSDILPSNGTVHPWRLSNCIIYDDQRNPNNL